MATRACFHPSRRPLRDLLRMRTVVCLGRFQHEVDAYGIKRKGNPPLIAPLQNAGVEKRMYVAMHGFYVAADSAGEIPDRHRTSAGHRPDEFPAFGRQQGK